MKLRILMAVVVLSLSLTLVGAALPDQAAAKDKVYRWRMQSFLPAGGEMYKLQAQFCDQ